MRTATAGSVLVLMVFTGTALCGELNGRRARTESDWGEPAEGLSVRLLTEKTVWNLTEPERFSIDIRNQGPETVLVARTQAAGELELDGVWYPWGVPVIVTYASLATGEHLEGIPVTLQGGIWRNGLKLAHAGPGKHTIRFAVLARRPAAGGVIRAISNPLEVEFGWTATQPVPLIPADGPLIADIQGRVLDETTGEPVTDFWVQQGLVTSDQPGQFVWTQMFTGPWIGRPGWFGVHGRKQGQVWRVLADGYLPQMVLEHPITNRVEDFNAVVRLKRGGELHGTVLDPNSRPVAGARVFLTTEQNPEFVDGTPKEPFRGGSATTDAAGCFSLRGVGNTRPKVVAVSPDGLQVVPAPDFNPSEEFKIILPKPASLILRYDIPGDEPDAELNLTLSCPWNGSFRQHRAPNTLKPSIPNGGQLVLTNLLPGTYNFYRVKMRNGAGTDARKAICDRLTVALDPGETQEIDLVRSVGHRVRGHVIGFDRADLLQCFLYVRSEIATGDPHPSAEWFLPCFDALALGKDGAFETTLLEPGNYTFVAHAYGPAPEETETRDGRTIMIVRSGIKMPAYIGTSKVTVTPAEPPPAVTIELSSR